MTSNYLRNIQLDATYGSGSPATLYFALFTVLPGADGLGGTELSTFSYARTSKTNNATFFPAASGGTKVKDPTDYVTFAPSGGDWDAVVGVGIYDASSGGNLLDYGPFTEAVDIVDGNTLRITDLSIS